MGLGAISVVAAYQLPLPPYRVGDVLHSISHWFKMALGGFSLPILKSIHGGKQIKPTKPMGSVMGTKKVVSGVGEGKQGDGSITELGEIVEVAMFVLTHYSRMVGVV